MLNLKQLRQFQVQVKHSIVCILTKQGPVFTLSFPLPHFRHFALATRPAWGSVEPEFGAEKSI